MEIAKVYNNNLVLARRGDGATVVLIGRGLGFGRRPGDQVDTAAVEQTFVPEDAAEETTVVDLLRHVPLDHVRLTEHLVSAAAERLRLTPSQPMFLALLDHLTFAIRRAEAGEEIDFPLHDAVVQLYPDEVALGREALAEVAARTGHRLQPEEASALAMHLVTAQLAAGSVSRTLAQTEVIGEVLDAVGAALGRGLDRSDVQTSRFVTHLRYLLARVNTGSRLDGPGASILTAVLESRPESGPPAAAAREVLERRLRTTLSVEELAYLTMHVARLLGRR